MSKSVEGFQDLGELKPILFEKGSDSYNCGEAVLYPDDSHAEAMKAINDVVREHFSESIAELRGEADRLAITKIKITSDDIPSIEYVTIEK